MCEGYAGDNGWAIGAGEEYTENDRTYQDDIESRTVYDLLEQEIVPMYYSRDLDGLPRAWIQRMKNSIATLAWRFSAHRMVMDYTRSCYVPAGGGLSCDMNVR